METRLLKTSDKNYLIGENGIVFDEDGQETKDIVEKNKYYFIKSQPVHRLVYQLFKGPIPPGYSCHHINICSRDNRISNLILIPNEEHIKLHSHLNKNKDFKQRLINSAQPHFYQFYCVKNGLQVKINGKSEPTTSNKYMFTKKELKQIELFNEAIAKSNKKKNYFKNIRYVIE